MIGKKGEGRVSEGEEVEPRSRFSVAMPVAFMISVITHGLCCTACYLGQMSSRQIEITCEFELYQ